MSFKDQTVFYESKLNNYDNKTTVLLTYKYITKVNERRAWALYKCSLIPTSWHFFENFYVKDF